MQISHYRFQKVRTGTVLWAYWSRCLWFAEERKDAFVLAQLGSLECGEAILVSLVGISTCLQQQLEDWKSQLIGHDVAERQGGQGRTAAWAWRVRVRAGL